MIILGIDPGTATTGYGIIEKNKTIRLIDYGCIETNSKLSTAERLNKISGELNALIKKHRPEKIAVEKIFFFKNNKTVISVAQARGVILNLASQLHLNIKEYTPLQIKQAVTSYGRAEKTQVQKMVKLLLNLKEIPQPDDAADALAAALCCANSCK